MIHAAVIETPDNPLTYLFPISYESRDIWHNDCSVYEWEEFIYTLEVRNQVKKFYYIALNHGKTCEGIIRSESIDSARQELMRRGLEEINVAILRSENMDFLDLGDQMEQGATS